MEKMIIQITAGKGPEECCLVVARVHHLLLAEAKKHNIEIEVLEEVAGRQRGTLKSVTMTAEGESLSAIRQEWEGSIQWTAQSPYRTGHKRKNWFVGVAMFNMADMPKWDMKEVRVETLRASGPGGQNVNKVETAVRGLHVPTGLQVLAMDSRSQLENKKLCLQRLQAKVMLSYTDQLSAQQQDKWRQHNTLSRGGPVKIIKAPLV